MFPAYPSSFRARTARPESRLASEYRLSHQRMCSRQTTRSAPCVRSRGWLSHLRRHRKHATPFCEGPLQPLHLGWPRIVESIFCVNCKLALFGSVALEAMWYSGSPFHKDSCLSSMQDRPIKSAAGRTCTASKKAEGGARADPADFHGDSIVRRVRTEAVLLPAEENSMCTRSLLARPLALTSPEHNHTCQSLPASSWTPGTGSICRAKPIGTPSGCQPWFPLKWQNGGGPAHTH